MAEGDPRQRLHSWLTENGMTHLADAVENATIAIMGGDLAVTAPKSYGLYFKDKAFDQAIREVFGRPLRIKMTLGESTAPQPALAGPRPVQNNEEDEATARAKEIEATNREIARRIDIAMDGIRGVIETQER